MSKHLADDVKTVQSSGIDDKTMAQNDVEKVQSTGIDIGTVQSATIDDKAVASNKDGDIALNLASELDAGYLPSPEVERRVRIKIDFILLPLISCTATLSFLDKVSNNYANNVSMDLALLIRLHLVYRE